MLKGHSLAFQPDSLGSLLKAGLGEGAFHISTGENIGMLRTTSKHNSIFHYEEHHTFMNTLLLSVIFFLWLVLPASGAAVGGDDILGEWVTEDRDCRVEMFKKEDRYFGKIVAIKQPNYLPGETRGMDGKPRLDSNNQNESLRSRPLVGLELMKNFRFDNDKWIDGRIYDPKNGETYNCEISLAEDGMLQIRGYVGVPFFGRTTVWEPARVYLDKELAFLGLTDCSCQ